MFSGEFCKIFKNIFSYRTSPVTASGHIFSDAIISCKIDIDIIQDHVKHLRWSV